MTVSRFAELGLTEPLLRALNEAQYDTPTPIQTQAIPHLLDGFDLLGIAQTGTGKTAAFSLPLLHNIDEDNVQAAPKAPALILAPTRELALQIADSIKTYGRHLRLRHAVVMGGVAQGSQVAALKRGVDILIATPGRLLDHVNQRTVDLGQCEYLVIDEADRMLDMGFIRDVRKIVARLPDERQSLLFSATMPAEIAKLAAEILYQPERVEIAAKTVAVVEKIDQQVRHMPAAAKRDALSGLFASDDLSKVIVFTRTKRGADRVAMGLERDGVSAEAIHGNKSQNARQRALDAFKKGRVRALVATDIAARGIDVDDVTHVINYELPHEPESYVHRIGRTARAGAAGVAISFCDAGERKQLQAIEKLIKTRLKVVGDAPDDTVVPLEAKVRGAGSRGDRRGPAPAGRKRRRSRPANRRAA